MADHTRRSLARLLAVAAMAPPVAVAQSPSTPADADLQSARETLRKSLEQIAEVKLPMAVEPACHFKAS